MASGGPAPLARMYREQLGRRARSVGTVGLLPELNGLSFETEEYKYEDAVFSKVLRSPRSHISRERPRGQRTRVSERGSHSHVSRSERSEPCGHALRDVVRRQAFKVRFRVRVRVSVWVWVRVRDLGFGFG